MSQKHENLPGKLCYLRGLNLLFKCECLLEMQSAQMAKFIALAHNCQLAKKNRKHKY